MPGRSSRSPWPPPSPGRSPMPCFRPTSRCALRTVLGSLSTGLRAGRDAVRDGDEEVAAQARLALADLDAHIAELSEALAMSTGAARLAPSRRRDRAQVESVRRVAPHLDLAA